MTDKPSCLPELPLRTRFALLVIGLCLGAVGLFLFLVSLAAAADGPGWPHVPLAFAMIWAVVAIWRSLARRWRANAGSWWVVELSDEPGGFQLCWQPQRWRDLLPWRASALWSAPARLPFVIILVLPQALAVHAAALGFPDGAMVAVWTGIQVSAVAWLALLSLSVVIVPFSQAQRSQARFTGNTVEYSPAPILPSAPPAAMAPLTHIAFMRVETRGLHFEPDGVRILAPKLYGLLPMSFRIPVGEPAIRKRLRQWATEHRIAVSDTGSRSVAAPTVPSA